MDSFVNADIGRLVSQAVESSGGQSHQSVDMDKLVFDTTKEIVVNWPDNGVAQYEQVLQINMPPGVVLASRVKLVNFWMTRVSLCQVSVLVVRKVEDAPVVSASTLSQPSSKWDDDTWTPTATIIPSHKTEVDIVRFKEDAAKAVIASTAGGKSKSFVADEDDDDEEDSFGDDDDDDEFGASAFTAGGGGVATTKIAVFHLSKGVSFTVPNVEPFVL